MAKLKIVVGGQFGSEAKGACAAALASRSYEQTGQAPLAVRTGGPNAGHTVWRDGVEYKLRQLPTPSVSVPGSMLAIAAGSVVDPELLAKELALISMVRDPRAAERVVVDEMATVLEPHHMDTEARDSGLHNWSTQKGIGAARSERVMRRAKVWRDISAPNTNTASVADLVRDHLASGVDVIVETAQGYGLGLHTPFYPKTTSADCRAIDAFAAIGISPWEFLTRGELVDDRAVQLEIWVVIRPYPIRVAGASGPLRNEVSWDELGLPEEHTTVTNKVRRVGLWDAQLVADAIKANGGRKTKVWFSMADQVIPELKGVTEDQWNGVNSSLWASSTETVRKVRDQLGDWHELIRVAGSRIRAVGTGPDTHFFMPGD